MPDMTPIFIDMAGRRIVIVGGGSVGERKARFFRRADVTVVSTGFTEELERRGAAGEIRLLRCRAGMDGMGGLVDGAFLVVAATDDAGLNADICRFCRDRGIPVNSASGPADVAIPSVAEAGEITLAVSTGGRSPAMARYLRRRLEAAITDDDRAMVRLQEALRARLKPLVPGQRERERILGLALEDEDVWKALETSESAALDLAMRIAGRRREP